MNIMHYSLGFPPFRRGGMIKYCMDLMSEEAKMGHNVYLLWPGVLKNSTNDMDVKIRKDYYIEETNVIIHSIEIINPLPVPLLNGIKEFDIFTLKKNVESIYKFLKENNIQVLHIHTLMGLPIEIIQICKKLNIKTVFTTHDYFGICPKWGLEREGNACVDDHNCLDCINCNRNALSLNKMKFLQSKFYRIFKNSYFLKILRKKNNTKLYIKENVVQVIENDDIKNRYQDLRKYYMQFLENCDIIHFNSNNTKNVYSRYIDINKNGVVIDISHGSIKERKRIRKVNDIVRFGYLGPITKHKGYFFLKKVCDELNSENQKFELHIFADCYDEAPYLKIHKPYEYNDLDDVMNKFDVLIVPSIWNETFGYTVLEALSYGIPVITTNNVGAKDLIINNKNGFISEITEFFLKNVLLNVIKTPEIISEMNRYIVSHVKIKTMKIHAKEMLEIYSLKLD